MKNRIAACERLIEKWQAQLEEERASGSWEIDSELYVRHGKMDQLQHCIKELREAIDR